MSARSLASVTRSAAQPLLPPPIVGLDDAAKVSKLICNKVFQFDCTLTQYEHERRLNFMQYLLGRALPPHIQ